MSTVEQPVSLTEALKDPAVRQDPYPTYASFRERGPLVPTPFGGYLLTRHADCFQVLRDARWSSSQKHQNGWENIEQLVESMGFGELFSIFGRVMLFADPPDHTRLRRIVSKAFTPRAVEAMRPRIAELVDGLLDDAAARGEMELVRDLAFPLPVTVIAEMLGMPKSELDQLQAWTSEAVKALDPSDDFMALVPAGQAVGEMRTYFDAFVAEKRRSPGDDLTSALIAAEDDGESLTHDELLDTMILLFGAGHETTVNLITGGVLNLLQHPSELARLQADPDGLIESAVEELLRFGPPVQVSARTATTDVELCGQRLEKGSQVVVMIAGANRDPEVFTDPDRLDIGRTENRHLAFGGGIHLCLGAPLARIEGQEAIGRLVRRFPDMALVDDEVVWKETATIRGPQHLRVSLTGR
ncbi:MAG TPA: cytochrome P450 [Acidimicrobiales bacterium]|nr:cytochrome P450 [Acidimicrobiales bacterium]